MCGVWRDCRRIHHCSYGRAQIQSCCQASQYRVCGDDEAILEGISVLDPCQPRSRGSTSRRSTHLLMDDASCTRTRLLFQEYIVAIENDKPLTAFWTSYLDMHVSCHSTMPRYHAFPLACQRCTNSSCKVVSVSSLMARIPSAASLWIKTSRTQSTEIHRQPGDRGL